MIDSDIKRLGMKSLIQGIGLVEAERFIALLNREPFDYTEWRKNLYKGMSVREISQSAMQSWEQKYGENRA